MSETIWQELTPDRIFAAVEAVLGKKLSNICQKRNSYINRVYELEEHDPRIRVIVKFYRPNRWSLDQINEEHRFLIELHSKEIPVIPPLSFNDKTVFTLPDPAPDPIPFSLFEKKGGRPVDEFDQEGWQTLGRTVGRLHLTSVQHKDSSRIIWRPSVATRHHLEMIAGTTFLPADFKKPFLDTVGSFIQKAEPVFKDEPFYLIHGDLHKGNLLYRPGEGLFLVDFDDMSLGPLMQDIWLLLPEGPDAGSQEFNWFLEGYETFRAFDWESIKLVPALQGMRIVHYAAWLAVQCQEPDFDHHFPHAGSPRYWNQLINELREVSQRIV